MITYHRIYFDNRLLSDYGTLDNIYITTPLPKYEMSQEELGQFINNNPSSVMFKYQFNKSIYAIARYCVTIDAMVLPIDFKILFDLLIFPSPIENKVPFCITSKSIKNCITNTIKTEVENLTSYNLLPYIENLTSDINSDQANFSTFYKKYKLGTLQFNRYSNHSSFTGGRIATYVYPYQNRQEHPNIRKYAIKNMVYKNTVRTKKQFNMVHLLNQQLRSLDKSTYDAMTNKDKADTRLDFSSYNTYKFIDFNDPNRMDSYNLQLKQYQLYSNYSTLNAYYMNQRDQHGDVAYVYPVSNVETIRQMIYNSWIIRGKSSDTVNTLDGINVLDETALNSLDLMYLSDASYFSLLNKFESWETQTPLTFIDDTKRIEFNQKSQIISDSYDCTSQFFDELNKINPSYVTDNEATITGGRYRMNLNGLRGHLTKNSKLIPFKLNTYVFSGSNDNVYPSTQYAIVSMNYLTKDTIDQLNSSDYTTTYGQLNDHFLDLTNIKYNQHYFVYQLTADSNGYITSKSYIDTVNLLDKEMFMFDKTDLTSFETTQQRFIINYNESINTKFAVGNFKHRYTHIVGTPTLATRQTIPVSTQRDSSVDVYDLSMNHLSDFTYTPSHEHVVTGRVYETQYTITQVSYSCDNSFTSDDMTNIVIGQGADATHYCLQNIIDYIYGYEDPIIANVAPIKNQNDFLWKDIVMSHLFSYNSQYLSVLQQARMVYQGISKDCYITTRPNSLTGSMYDVKWFKQIQLSASWYNSCEGNTTKVTSTPNGRIRHIHAGSTSYEDVNLSQSNPPMYATGKYSFRTDSTPRLGEDVTFVRDLDYSIRGFWQTYYPYGSHDQELSLGTIDLQDNTTTNYVVGKNNINTQTVSNYLTGGSPDFAAPRSIEPNLQIMKINRLASDAAVGRQRSDTFFRVSDVFNAMTPFDLLLREDTTTFTRLLSNTSPYNKWGRKVNYIVKEIDSSTILPTSFTIYDAIYDKYNIGINTSGESTQIYRKLYSQGYFNSKLISAGTFQYELYNINSENNQTTFLKEIPIDYSNNLIYFEPETLDKYIAMTQASTTKENYSVNEYHYRTPISGYYTNNITATKISKDNALLDYLIYNIPTENGYILLSNDISQVDFAQSYFSIDQTPYQNKITNQYSDDSISVYAYGDMLCIGGIDSISDVTNDAYIKIKISPTNHTYDYTRNIGYPIFQFTPATELTTNMSLVELINTNSFAHFCQLNLKKMFGDYTDLLYLIKTDYVDLTYDANNTEISITPYNNPSISYLFDIKVNVNVPLLHDIVTPALTTTTISGDYRIYQTLSEFNEDALSQYTPETGQVNIGGTDYWKMMTVNPQYDNFDYENKDASSTTEQSTKYMETKLNSSFDNIIKNTDIEDIGESTPLFTNFIASCITTANLFTKYNTIYDLFMEFDEANYIIFKSNNSYIIIDKIGGYIYCLYLLKSTTNHVINCSKVDYSDNINNILFSFFTSENLLVKNVYKVPNTNAACNALISIISSKELAPVGNMYIITDYLESFKSELFNDLISSF